jgi:hypothetical protein
LLAGADPLRAARHLLADREPLYARAALHVDAERHSPAEIAALVEREVRARAGPA